MTKLSRIRKYHYKKKVIELASSPHQLVNEAIVEHGALRENEASSLVLPIPAVVEHGALTENEASSLVLPIPACEAVVEHGALTDNEASLVLSIPLTAACVPTLIGCIYRSIDLADNYFVCIYMHCSVRQIANSMHVTQVMLMLY